MANRFAQFPILKHLVRWLILIIPVSVTIGSIVALFLWLLHQATGLRFQYPWMLFLLPLAGIAIHLIYKTIGRSSEKGNNLIIDEIHEPGGGIPGWMAPVILVCTVITHLFGGSAGREGTAVQIGGSIAQIFGKLFRLNADDTKIILTSGVAAGFGAVFGTPLAGTIFAAEVLSVGRIQYTSLLPCLFAAIIGDATVTAWGIHHTTYHIGVTAGVQELIPGYISPAFSLLIKVVPAAIAFGLAACLFSVMVHTLRNLFLKLIRTSWLIPVAGGLIIILLTFITGSTDYLGLGVDPQYAGSVTISSSFKAGGADTWSWLWKTGYTTITLSSGFKGGEVTPLFYIGATLGNTLSGILDAPAGLFAALGFIAVFAGATNTPLACTIMGVELFGSEYMHLFAAACFIAYFFSGHSGIYSSQKIAVPKIFGEWFSSESSLSESNKRRNNFLQRRLTFYRFLFRKKRK